MVRLRYYLKLVVEPSKLVHDIKVWQLRRKGMFIQQNVDINFPLHYRYPKCILICEGAVIGEGCSLIAGPQSRIYIGLNTLLAPNVHVNTTKHIYKDVDKLIKRQGSEEKSVAVSDDCWVGTGAVILADVGYGSVVGANSVVTKNTMPYTVVAGNPAVLIKKRGEGHVN